LDLAPGSQDLSIVRFRDDIARTKDAATGLWRLALDPGGD
jgi:hypothetical protein